MGALRIGQGFDVHPLVDGRRLILGGVEIPHEKGLEGHSDADVLLHALTDAILGALAWGDIGQWFPNTEPQYRGADSLTLLSAVWQRAHSEGWTVVNCDCMLLAERPKVKDYLPTMQARIAERLGAQPTQIGIKATTTERLGFVGREEGIAASAVVLLQREP